MGRVTIQDIYYDGAVDYSDKVKHIEVVPRKIVEMIIEYCEHSIKNYPHTMVALNAGNTKDYAESLLKQFEEGKDE